MCKCCKKHANVFMRACLISAGTEICVRETLTFATLGVSSPVSPHFLCGLRTPIHKNDMNMFTLFLLPPSPPPRACLPCLSRTPSVLAVDLILRHCLALMRRIVTKWVSLKVICMDGTTAGWRGNVMV